MYEITKAKSTKRGTTFTVTFKPKVLNADDCTLSSDGSLITIQNPIEESDFSLGKFSIEVETFKTNLPDGAYDAVAWRDFACTRDRQEIRIYQKAKAQLWVKDHEFVPYAVDNVCTELVASDPHHCALEGFELIDPKTVELHFGS